MTWGHTPDGGDTVDDRQPDRPTQVWVQDTPEAGHYEPVAVDAEANGLDWWEIRPSPRPAGNIAATPQWAIVTGMLERQWVFDQATQDAEDAEAADETERQTVRDLLPQIITQRDQMDTVQTNIDTVIAALPGSNDNTRRQLIDDLAAEVSELAQGQRLAMRALKRIVGDM